MWWKFLNVLKTKREKKSKTCKKYSQKYKTNLKINISMKFYSKNLKSQNNCQETPAQNYFKFISLRKKTWNLWTWNVCCLISQEIVESRATSWDVAVSCLLNNVASDCTFESSTSAASYKNVNIKTRFTITSHCI